PPTHPPSQLRFLVLPTWPRAPRWRFPVSGLMACFNALLATDRQRKRAELLEATAHDLDKIAKEVARRTKTPLSPTDIGKKVGKVLYNYKVAKHFKVTLDAAGFHYERRVE